MPSTYNNNLRIEIIATGEQSGTWGTTTNNNLGTLIVDAITGMTSVTTNISPYTLTALNGIADQSRAAALELQTSTGANFIVVVPTLTKLYVVKNVDPTYTVTVKTAAGSGIDVPPGKTTLVRCDGTDVVEQVNHLDTLSLGTPLPISAGGTNASTTSGARSNLGATTVGGNLFTLADPSAVTFPRFNADNSVSALNAADFRTAIAAVTSVAASAPVASSGGLTPTISLAASYGDTQNPYASKTANHVLAAPSGSAGVPSFRALVAADLPGFASSLGNNGYQIFPGGLMIQWGRYTSTIDGPQTFSYPTTFPNGVFVAVTNYEDTNFSSLALNSINVSGLRSQFTVNREDNVQGDQPFYLIAIGY